MASPAIADSTCVCECCGSTFAPRRRGNKDSNRCCSRACGFEVLRRDRQAASEQRTALIQAQRHAARQHVCLNCNVAFEAQPSAKYCSPHCSGQHHDKMRKGPKPERSCRECERLFTAEYGDKRRAFCSDTCKARHHKRAAKGKERARDYGDAAPASINPIRIMERDGWRCHICGGDAPRELRGTFAAEAPEIDHVIPLSRGGRHIESNVACAHRRCNIEKGDGLTREDAHPARRWVHR